MTEPFDFEITKRLQKISAVHEALAEAFEKLVKDPSVKIRFKNTAENQIQNLTQILQGALEKNKPDRLKKFDSTLENLIAEWEQMLPKSESDQEMQKNLERSKYIDELVKKYTENLPALTPTENNENDYEYRKQIEDRKTGKREIINSRNFDLTKPKNH
jgi:hypothetical protein